MPVAIQARGGTDRVSTLELFFDLVFVFTITQIARLTAAAHRPRDFVAALLILTIAWWMYGGYAWLTNNVGTDGTWLRLLILLGTAAYFVMALAIPRAGAGRAGGRADWLALVERRRNRRTRPRARGNVSD